MKIPNLLHRATRIFISRQKAKREKEALNSIYGDVDGQLRIMSDREFAEYLRLHTKSHRWNV